jgi:hypothetical protein
MRFSDSTVGRVQRFNHRNLTSGQLKTIPCGEQVITTVAACQPDGAAAAAQNNTVLPAIQPYQFTLTQRAFHIPFPPTFIMVTPYTALRHKNRYKKTVL